MNAVLLLVATFLTALLSMIGGVLFLSKSKMARRVQKFGPVIAAVVLLYDIFGEIIPEILEEETLAPLDMIYLILVGFVVCALFGWVLGHFHHHADAHSVSNKETQKHLRNRSEAITMLIVDTIHNAADGIVIGVSFIADPVAGLTTCLATVAHEIPQEVGDFSIMQKSKIPKKKIIKLQFYSALAVIPAAIIAYFVGDILTAGLPSILAVVAGFFLYIAISEIYCVFDMIRARTPKQLK